MQKLLRGIRTVMETLLTRRPADNSRSNSVLDWLPPVLGPGDWSIGLMTDQSTTWYFDRH